MTRTKKPKIFIIEDHQVVRKGLREMLTEFDYEICGEAEDCQNGLKGIKASRPEAVILDLSLGDEDGITIIPDIKELEIPVLVFSMHEDPSHVQRALQAGAQGYVTKQEVMDILIDGIEEILAGKTFVSKRITETMINSWSHKDQEPESDSFESLSKRELEVYLFVGQGYSFSEIAEKLFLSPKTIESYIARIKTKLNLKSNRDLLRHAINHLRRSEI